jgi:transcription elongation factor Elf1
MPSVALRVTRAAPEDRTDHRSPEAVKPLFRGNGDTDYLCGSCGAVMAASMAPSQHVIVDTATCSACGAENEFPLHLRA